MLLLDRNPIDEHLKQYHGCGKVSRTAGFRVVAGGRAGREVRVEQEEVEQARIMPAA
ncbi:MAG: hypothetical protein QXN26_06985 [Thermoplasmataceae archaeon]